MRSSTGSAVDRVVFILRQNFPSRSGYQYWNSRVRSLDQPQSPGKSHLNELARSRRVVSPTMNILRGLRASVVQLKYLGL